MGREGRLGSTYAAEKVAYKDDEHPPRGIPSVIQAPESPRLPLLIEHQMILQLPQHLHRWHIVVNRALGVPGQLRRRRRPRVGLQRGQRRGVGGSARGRRARLGRRVWVWGVSSLPRWGDGGGERGFISGIMELTGGRGVCCRRHCDGGPGRCKSRVLFVESRGVCRLRARGVGAKMQAAAVVPLWNTEGFVGV